MRGRFYNNDGEQRIALELPDGSVRDYHLASNCEKNELYKSIYRGERISISNSLYINFSISDYKQLYKIDPHDLIQIDIDSIYDCCFASEGTTAFDLSYCIVIATDKEAGLMLDECLFLNGEVDLSYSVFDESDFSMKECMFYNSSVNFSFSRFLSRNFYFNEINAYNTACDAFFRGTVFENAEDIDFSHCKNICGTFEYYRVNFGSSTADFTYLECPNTDFVFFEIESSMQPLSFTDSIVNKVVFYKTNVNGLLDLRIGRANFITMQECIIRDAILLGNKGYRNFTSYCFKDSSILGRVQIMNPISSRLFKSQLQVDCSSESEEMTLVKTSFSDKAVQMMVLSQNYLNIGDSKSADKTYVLNKRYLSLGRMQDLYIDIKSIKHTYPGRKKIIIRIANYIIYSTRLVTALVAAFFEFTVLDILCGEYATKPGKFFGWMLMIIMGFACSFFFLADHGNLIMSTNQIVTHSSFLAAALLSVRVFFQTEAVSASTFSGTVNLLMLIEQIIGIIVLALFAVSYTRKVIK